MTGQGDLLGDGSQGKDLMEVRGVQQAGITMPITVGEPTARAAVATLCGFSDGRHLESLGGCLSDLDGRYRGELVVIEAGDLAGSTQGGTLDSLGGHLEGVVTGGITPNRHETSVHCQTQHPAQSLGGGTKGGGKPDGVVLGILTGTLDEGALNLPVIQISGTVDAPDVVNGRCRKNDVMLV